MTEQEYRALDIDSYSSIKVFIEDRKKYYKKFVLREVIRDQDTQSTIFGSLVDCLLFSVDEFDNRFAMAITDVPKGQYGKLVDELMKVTVECLNEQGEVTREIEDMLKDAYNKVKYDRVGTIVDFKRDTFEKVKEKFIGSDLEMYYRQLREAHGKEVVEPSMVNNALAVINSLKTNQFVAHIINLTNSTRFTVYDQFPIIGEISAMLIGTESEGMPYPLKCLVDRLVIDHEKKLISIYDLKTAWDNEGEFVNNYFRYKYYIQAAVYFYLVLEWAIKQKDLKDYQIEFPKFIVADSTNYKDPLIYTTDKENFEQGMRGFMIKGKYYPGVKNAIADMIWHRRNGIWSISRENFKSNGVVRMKPFET